MKYSWEPVKKPKVLTVQVYPVRPQGIMISVYDWKKRDSVYSRQTTWVNGPEEFVISLPLTPEKAFIEIRPANQANMLFGGVDAGLQANIKVADFTPGLSCNFSKDKHLQDFLRFITWFSENAGILSPGIYRSVSGHFEILYSPVIMEDKYINRGGKIVENPRYGLESPTSFRVDANKENSNGVTKMELSQKYVTKYTIPGRVGLFLHEGSHDFINENPDDEAEADKNALEIASCLGFEDREIANVFTDVFLRYPSDENVRRSQLIIEHRKARK